MNRDIKSVIDYVLLYAGSSEDWLSVKKEILWILPPRRRSLFSRRHYSTKKHTINKFEQEVMAYWKKKTGLELKIADDKLHDVNWVQNKSGWGLLKYHEERRKLARERKQKQEDEQRASGGLDSSGTASGTTPGRSKRKKKSKRKSASKRK